MLIRSLIIQELPWSFWWKVTGIIEVVVSLNKCTQDRREETVSLVLPPSFFICRIFYWKMKIFEIYTTIVVGIYKSKPDNGKLYIALSAQATKPQWNVTIEYRLKPEQQTVIVSVSLQSIGSWLKLLLVIFHFRFMDWAGARRHEPSLLVCKNC